MLKLNFFVTSNHTYLYPLHIMNTFKTLLDNHFSKNMTQ